MEFDTALLVRSDGVKSYNYLIAASAVWLSSFSMGTCYGYSAPAKSSMLAMDEFPISEQQFQWLASILMFGGLVGALTGGRFYPTGHSQSMIMAGNRPTYQGLPRSSFLFVDTLKSA